MERRSGDATTWLLGGATALCLAALVGLLGLLAAAGLEPLWPGSVSELQPKDGEVLLGEIVAVEDHAIALRTSEIDRIGEAYRRVSDADIVARTQPQYAIANTLVDGRRLFGRDRRSSAESLLVSASKPAAVLDTLARMRLDSSPRAAYSCATSGASLVRRRRRRISPVACCLH